MRPRATALIGMAILALTWVAPCIANPWDEKTVLKFDEAVAVPGATLQPGTYVFQIADTTSARHTIRITREDTNQVLATVQAVPMRRESATNDIVLRFAPTEPGGAPAVKGWYYPGRLYGHQFIYPDDEARHIAERAHTLVLADDAPGMLSKKGTLHVIDAQGALTEWHPDEALTHEWDSWSRTRNSSAATKADPGSSALVQADRLGMHVKLDDLENDPSRFIGKRVSVDGEVDDIVGPRIFKLDEPGWADLEGELLVVLPAGTGALLKENDKISVSGTVRQFVRADVDRDWGWLNDSPELELTLAHKAVIVADRIIGGDENRTVIIRARSQDAPVGTSGLTASAPGVGANGANPITDAVTLATGDDDLVGRPVHLDGLTVTGVDAGHGFFIGPRERQLFVLTQYLTNSEPIRTGQTVSFDGFVMQMPDTARSGLNAPGALNKHIYVYATGMN